MKKQKKRSIRRWKSSTNIFGITRWIGGWHGARFF
jgi:hypothetical protein